MGIFCSYYVNNDFAQLRHTILTDELPKIKDKSTLDNNDSNKVKTDLTQYSNLTQYINTEIDRDGNTALLFSIENRKIESFRFLLSEFTPDVNKSNYYTKFQPLHLCALTKTSYKPIHLYSGYSNVAFSPHPEEPISPKFYQSFSEEDKISKTKDKISKRSSFDSQNKKTLVRTVSLKEEISRTNKNTLSRTNTKNSIDIEIGNNLMTIEEDMLREMMKLLIEKGADLNGTVTMDKTVQLWDGYHIKTITPLIGAILSNNMVAIEELNKAGCNCDYQENLFDLAAIHIACRLSKPDIVKLLVQTGDANVNLKTKNGESCLHWLAKCEQDDSYIFQLIMNNFAQKRERYGNMKISVEDHWQSVIDQTNHKKQTAIMLAAMNNHQNLVKFLLDYDASLSKIDENGESVLDYAKKNSCAQLISSYMKINKTIKNKNFDNQNQEK